MNPIQLRHGDILRLRRPHPCGNDQFEVVRLGADIGLNCTACGRRVLLARSLLERRMQGFVRRGADPQPPADMGDGGLDTLGPGDAGLGDPEIDADVLTPSALRADDLSPDGPDPDPLDLPRPAR